jgi:molybdate/tungstate transport system permease protein
MSGQQPTVVPRKRISRAGRLRHRLIWVFAAVGALLVLAVAWPLLRTLLSTTPRALWQALLDPAVRQSVLITFYAAAIATALALVTGVPLAYVLARADFPGKHLVEGIINLPIVVPHTAAGIALLMVLGRQSLLGRLAGLAGVTFVDAVPGVVAGMLFVSLPFLVTSARDAIAAVDPELERVAETLGASPWQAVRYVTLPLAWRGIMSGAAMMWGRAISEFGAVIILAYHPSTVPVLVYERFSGFGLAAATPVAVWLIVASLLVFLALRLLAGDDPDAVPESDF